VTRTSTRSKDALEHAGVEFIEGGVRMRKGGK
jgi:hypothetical protein